MTGLREGRFVKEVKGRKGGSETGDNGERDGERDKGGGGTPFSGDMVLEEEIYLPRKGGVSLILGGHRS